jgi:hypothetical protein
MSITRMKRDERWGKSRIVCTVMSMLTHTSRSWLSLRSQLICRVVSALDYR